MSQFSHPGKLLQSVGEDVVVGPEPAALGVDDCSFAEFLEAVGQRGLGDVEERDQFEAHRVGCPACHGAPGSLARAGEPIPGAVPDTPRRPV